MAKTLSLLTICGLDEIEGHGARAVTHVVSILDPDRDDPDFTSYGPVTRAVLRFHDAIEPAPAIVLPTDADVATILAFGRAVAEEAGEGEVHLLVHCHAGISRSTAAMVMILAQAHPKETEAAIVARVAAVRPQAWPNLRMIEAADIQLGRGGRLVAAVAALYASRLAARPELAAVMVRLDRAREVAVARRPPEAA